MEAGYEFWLGSDPAEAAAGRDGFAKGVEADDAAGCVQCDEAGGEGFEEWIFSRACGGEGGGGILEVPVRVVFDDDDVETLAEGVYSAASGESEGAASWVLAHGDGVHEVWAAALDAGVPVLEDVAEATGAVRADSLGVHPDGDDADAVGGGGLDAVRVGKVLNKHVVAAFAQEVDGFTEAVGVAARQYNSGVAVRDAATVQVVQRKVGNEGCKRRQSAHAGVLERGGDIDPGSRICGRRGEFWDGDVDGRAVRVRHRERLFGAKGEAREQWGGGDGRDRVELGGEGRDEAGGFRHGGFERVEGKVGRERETCGM